MPDMSSISAHSNLLAPGIALVLWSLVMWVWMYATRLPAMQKLEGDLDNTMTTTELAGSIPPPARWKADNYNHLMEQPTIFYAALIIAAMAGLDDGMNLYCAWAFVGLRVVHSIIQSTVNNIPVRFLVFALSTVALAILSINTAIEVF